ncbi:MAG: hypothetical protein KAS72_06665 [Phycisphaerales bacterium]|nr:hypothetical protein [Phycisphaerales bacterium]
MSRLTPQYDIARFSGRCAATGKKLAPGDPYIAALVERSDDDGLDRIDYSLDAWETGQRPAKLFSYWRACVPDADARRRPFVDDDVLLGLFERLADEDQPQRIAFRFVLGLMLIRKKLLRFERSERTDGVEHWLVRPKGVPSTEPADRFVNPELDADAIRGVTDQLSEILSGEL